MSSPIGLLWMINQFQLLFILVVSKAYLSVGILSLITGMKMALLSFDFIKIEKIQIIEYIYDSFGLPQSNYFLIQIGIVQL